MNFLIDPHMYINNVHRAIVTQYWLLKIALIVVKMK